MPWFSVEDDRKPSYLYSNKTDRANSGHRIIYSEKMKDDRDRNRILADYLYNDLDPVEREVLEREMQKNPDFYKSYQLSVEVKDYLLAKIQLEEMRSDPMLENAEKLADLAFDVENHDEEEKATISIGTRKRNRKIAYALAIAATVAIILSFGIFPASIDQDRLFDRYYEPIEASDFTQRGESNDLYGEIARGINYYVDGDYSQSINQFSDLASNPAIRSEVLFFTALSHLGLGQYQQAQSILEALVDSEIRYQAETLWYLSLSYLKSGELEKSNAYLGQLEIYDGMYKQDAQALGKKLRRFK